MSISLEPTTRLSLVELQARSRSELTDVSPGLAPRTRRLRLEAPSTAEALTVVLPEDDDAEPAVEAEAAFLVQASMRQLGRAAAAVPRFEELVSVCGRDSVVLSSPLGAPVARPLAKQQVAPSSTTAAEHLGQLHTWLSELWSESSDGTAPLQVGAAAQAAWTARDDDAAAALLAAITPVRARLAAIEAPLALTHGCLCPRHLRTDGRAIVSVDDWHRGSLQGDAVADLARFAVTYWPQGLRGLLLGAGSYAAAVTPAVCDALVVLGVDVPLDDLLLAAAADAAVDPAATDITEAVLLDHLGATLEQEVAP